MALQFCWCHDSFLASVGGSRTGLNDLGRVDGTTIGLGLKEWPDTDRMLLPSPCLPFFDTGKCPLPVHCFLYFFLGTRDGERSRNAHSAIGAFNTEV